MMYSSVKSLIAVVLLFLLSVQGALQLKQDFDSIRELIQSDKYGLSAELHQRLLSLRYRNLCFIHWLSKIVARATVLSPGSSKIAEMCSVGEAEESLVS